jgi:hypothetical protein
VDGDHRAGADELVQLDVVDVAARAQLGGVQDDEDVVAVGPHLGHGVALDTGLDRQGVEAEHLPQHLGGLLVADGDVDPDQPIVAGEQLLQLPHRMLLDSFIGHKANVHPAGHLLEAVPAPSLAPPRPRRLSSRAEHPKHEPLVELQLRPDALNVAFVNAVDERFGFRAGEPDGLKVVEVPADLLSSREVAAGELEHADLVHGKAPGVHAIAKALVGAQNDPSMQASVRYPVMIFKPLLGRAVH